MFIKTLRVKYNAFINSTLHSPNETDWIRVQRLKKYNWYLKEYLYIYILILVYIHSHIYIYIICATCMFIYNYIYISILLRYVGWSLVAGIVIRYGLGGPGSNSGGGEIFGTRLDRPWAPPSPLYECRASFPEVKRPERGVDHPPNLMPRCPVLSWTLAIILLHFKYIYIYIYICIYISILYSCHYYKYSGLLGYHTVQSGT